MTHRAFAVIALLVVFGLALASTGCVARAQSTGIHCDGYDRSSGTLRYSCANVDYDKLAVISPIFAGRGKVTQIWVRSYDPSVTRFVVGATWNTSDGIAGDWKMLSRNGSQQTIFEFPTGGSELKSAVIEELKTTSVTEWKS